MDGEELKVTDDRFKLDLIGVLSSLSYLPYLARLKSSVSKSRNDSSNSDMSPRVIRYLLRIYWTLSYLEYPIARVYRVPFIFYYFNVCFEFRERGFRFCALYVAPLFRSESLPLARILANLQIL